MVVSDKVKYALSDRFLGMYKDKTPPWGPVGYVVYKRTYARWIPSEGRTEEWWETCRRVIEGNFNLVDDPRPQSEVLEEMEEAYDLMWRMIWLPPGRGLWISGTDSAARNGSSLFNCWGIVVEPSAYYPSQGSSIKASTPFVMAMDLLMLGGGIGYSVVPENVDKFRKVNNHVNLHIVCDPKHPNVAELGSGSIPPRDKDHTYIRVSDSRRGWTDALRVLIDSHFKNTNYDYNLVIDVSDVRSAGKRIKGFGGTSAGPGPLVRMLRAIHTILKSAAGRKLTPVECSDIMCNIGKCVVSGNVRRSAMLGLFSVDDDEAINMKLDKEKLNEIRWAANMSTSVDDEFDDYEKLGHAIATNGEPGIVNLERCRNYGRFIDGLQPGIDGAVQIVNPCSEANLEHAEPCCLAEIFPYRIMTAGEDYEKVARIAFRYTKRVTFAKHEWEAVQEVVGRNRRVGPGISGWEDWKQAISADRSPEEAEKYRQEILNKMYLAMKDEDEKFSKLLGCETSIKISTIKPSGSISLLNGSSPGRHAHYSKYVIRRVRLAHKDPMVELLKAAGIHVEDDLVSPNTVVADFPVKAPTGDLPTFKAAPDYSLEDQCKDQMELQTWWADQSVSSTLTFKPEEAKLIPDMLKRYKFKSTSMLPYADHGYAQAPYEPITEERYNEMMAVIKFWPSDTSFREYREQRDMEILDQTDCEGGACPIK